MLGPVDASTVLGLYVVVLLAVPSALRLNGLGGSGSLAGLLSLLIGLWWAWSELDKSGHVARGRRPLGVVAGLLVICVLLAYLAAMRRPLPPLEASQADLALLRVLGPIGVLLVASTGITNGQRLLDLVRVVVWGCTAVAALGLTQFLTGRVWVDVITLPAMSNSQEFSGVVGRGDFLRAAGTAMSPLEYATVLSAGLPLAAALALHDRTRSAWQRWLPFVLVGAALATSASRTALIGLLVGMAVVFPFWPGRVKWRMSVLLVGGFGLLLAATPGMFGTLRYLFTEGLNDSGAQSRTGSYELAQLFIANSPLFGRGFGTFLPQYRILDNQYLLFAVEVGLIGLGVLLLLVGTAFWSALSARRCTDEPLLAQLGPALAASMAAVAVTTFFFDAFSFPQSAGVFFLITGLCGGYRQVLCADVAHQRTSSPDASSEL